jgi:hypothetical protein
MRWNHANALEKQGLAKIASPTELTGYSATLAHDGISQKRRIS